MHIFQLISHGLWSHRKWAGLAYPPFLLFRELKIYILVLFPRVNKIHKHRRCKSKIEKLKLKSPHTLNFGYSIKMSNWKKA